jgi:hypothetical protein
MNTRTGGEQMCYLWNILSTRSAYKSSKICWKCGEEGIRLVKVFNCIDCKVFGKTYIVNNDLNVARKVCKRIKRLSN